MLGGGGNSQAAAACRSYAIACDPGSLIVVFFVAFLIAVDLKLKVFLCSVAAPFGGYVEVGV
jgi:hypothetical protein